MSISGEMVIQQFKKGFQIRNAYGLAAKKLLGLNTIVNVGMFLTLQHVVFDRREKETSNERIIIGYDQIDGREAYFYAHNYSVAEGIMGR